MKHVEQKGVVSATKVSIRRLPWMVEQGSWSFVEVVEGIGLV